ncbi:T9SS type A sorting domain-containing protein [Winogradskyella sp. DF17]|uniref:T9SS type A sorting domain-containing protein n=1 Tax=Winogradskyella pelagia TaxID=2819984 RepID=A0ABS3T2X0_9FLAO|nr:T9SS type A sorting domain-containing protein [Winogradskyella sp. DF17]MBO3117093.1 T9SS type A sorting domain-containing protein [Winogradskyella sp. DF17]
MKTFIALLLFINIAYTQTTDIIWQNTINASDFDTVFTALTLSDGSSLVVATSDSNASGDKSENSNGGNDIWLIRLDAQGDILWEETLGGSLSDFINSAQETTDGGFILAGGSKSDISGDKTENNIGENDVWVIKINATGTIEWQNTIGGTNSDSARAIALTNDGGYIVSASSESGISGDKTEGRKGQIDIWLLKLNSSGTLQWQNTIGSNGDDIPTVVGQTNDGGYIIGGYSNSDAEDDKSEGVSGFNDFWVIKTDNLGVIEWENTIGGNASDILRDLVILDNDNFVLAGYSDSNISLDKTQDSRGTFDYWIVELAANGSILGQSTIGGDDEDFAFDIKVTTDGNYLIAGQSKSDTSGEKLKDSNGAIDYWPVKIDNNGTILWQETIGGNANDNLVCAAETDNGYILYGHSFSDVNGDKDENSDFIDPWIVKLNKEPTFSIEDDTLNKITVYPNPSSSIVFLNNKENELLVLMDILGNEIQRTTKSQIDISNLTSGVYLVKIFDQKKGLISVKKIIKP